MGRCLYVRVRREPRRRDRFHFPLHISSRVDGDNAVGLFRFGRVNGFNVRVGVGTAKHHSVQRVAEPNVVSEAAVSCNETGVLPPFQRSAEDVRHFQSPSFTSPAVTGCFSLSPSAILSAAY